MGLRSRLQNGVTKKCRKRSRTCDIRRREMEKAPTAVGAFFRCGREVSYCWVPSGHCRKVPLAYTMSSLKSVVVPQTDGVVGAALFRPPLAML